MSATMRARTLIDGYHPHQVRASRNLLIQKVFNQMLRMSLRAATDMAVEVRDTCPFSQAAERVYK